MDRDKPLILTGTVVHGKAIGRTVGMPTANIAISDACNLPEYGVYATRLLVHGKVYQAVTNIGLRPTVDDKQEVTVEAHVLDFSDDIYGEIVQLEVCDFLRPIQKFSGLEEVYAQVKKDIEMAKNLLDTHATK